MSDDWAGAFDRDDSERLDRWLAAQLDRPRNKVQRWIRDGRVQLNDADPAGLKPSHALQRGDRVICRIPEPQPDPVVEPEEGKLRVLYEDPHLVVLDKPAELAVHPGAGRPTGTLAHRLLHHYPETAGVGGPGRPGIVHRLDLDTTGCLAVARTEKAYLGLTQAFAEREVDKTYLAVVHGVPDASGTIDANIGRHPHDRKRMTVRGDGSRWGRRAVSHFRRLASADPVANVAAVLAVDIETGRTHQIRVHLKHAGHPIVGDPIYGESRWRGVPSRFQKALREFGRPALHAWRLAFDHPVTGERIDVQAPVPADLIDLWEALSGSERFPLPAPPAD